MESVLGMIANFTFGTAIRTRNIGEYFLCYVYSIVNIITFGTVIMRILGISLTV